MNTAATAPPAPSQPAPVQRVASRLAPSLRRIRIPFRFVAIGLGVLLVVGVAAFLLIGRTTRGTLVSLSTGRPVANALIRGDSGTARTDAEGVFTMSSLRIGNHEVTVSATGFPSFKATLNVAAIGGGDNRLKLPDASVSVHIVETALQPKTDGAGDVRIAGKTVSADASGTYIMKGLRTGSATISVSGPSYEPTTTTVDLKPGVNDVDVNVTLTPAETYMRYFEAYKAGQWKAAYAYLHPDVVKRESLATYTHDMKAWGTPVSIDMQGTKMLPKWPSPFTQLTYTNVAEVRRTLVSQLKGGRLQSSKPQHWVKVGGMWLRIDL